MKDTMKDIMKDTTKDTMKKKTFRFRFRLRVRTTLSLALLTLFFFFFFFFFFGCHQPTRNMVNAQVSEGDESEDSDEDVFVLRVTTRDFSPCTCLNEEQRDFFFPSSIYGTGDRPDPGDFALCQGREGKGHPDFERQSETTSLSQSEFTSEELDYSDTSGIPKIQYGNDETSESDGPLPGQDESSTCTSEGRCESMTSGADIFKQWYRDYHDVNKRVGHKIILRKVPSTDGLFRFNSQVESAEAIEACQGVRCIEDVDESSVCDHDAVPGNLEPGYNDAGTSTVEGCYQKLSSTGTRFGNFGAFNSRPTTLDARAPGTGWPRETSKETQSGDYFHLPVKFGHTSEVHTFFEYQPGQEFEFRGDDDTWVFINGTRAGGVPGTHGPQEFTVNLDDLDLEVGEIYPLDFFHAERQSWGAVTAITTSLSSGCNVINTPPASKQLLTANFSSEAAILDQFKLVGAKLDLEQEAIILSELGAQYRTSYFWTREQVNVGTGFDIRFTFHVQNDTDFENVGGDGFALVLQRSKITNLNGGVGGNIGLRNLPESFALVFDWCEKRRTNPSNDCFDHEIKLVHNGPENKVRYTALLPDFRDGEEHEVVLSSYVRPNWVEVFVDDDLYLREDQFTIENVIGGRNAWVGFTASTSQGTLDQVITAFEVETVDVDDESSRLLDGPSFNPKNLDDNIIVADGRDDGNGGFTVVTYDFCNNSIEFGGRDEAISAQIIQEDVDEPATFNPSEIVDNGDGSYEVRFTPNVAGTYSLTITYAGMPLCLYPLDTREDGDLRLTENSTDPNGNSVLCSPFASVLRAEAPPEEDEDEDRSSTGLSRDVVLGIGVASGLVACVGTTAIAVMYFRFVRKWRRDKAFVDKGKLAAAEKDVEYTNPDEGNIIARRLQDTREQLQAERAREGANADASESVIKLKQQTEELGEQVRMMKQRSQQGESMVAASGASGAEAVKPQRKQFGAVRAD